jgi:hypothetical protein
MRVQFDTFEERDNKFFVEMLKDLNPKVYSISTSRFVHIDKGYLLKGQITPNAHVDVYVNGIFNNHVDAIGDGSFQLYITLVDDENEVTLQF